MKAWYAQHLVSIGLEFPCMAWLMFCICHMYIYLPTVDIIVNWSKWPYTNKLATQLPTFTNEFITMGLECKKISNFYKIPTKMAFQCSTIQHIQVCIGQREVPCSAKHIVSFLSGTLQWSRWWWLWWLLSELSAPDRLWQDLKKSEWWTMTSIIQYIVDTVNRFIWHVQYICMYVCMLVHTDKPR